MERLISYRVVREGRASSRRDRGFAWGKLVIAVFVVIFIAVLLFPTFAQDKNGPLSQTLHHLKMLAMANAMYAEDFDGRLPVAER